MVLSSSRGFWATLTFFSGLAAFLSYTYLGDVYSLVNLAITADRQQVLVEAKKLATELHWDIAEYQDVTSFENEDELQCFVELEAGGKDAFVDMFQSDLYHPYHWHVRFFKEKEVVEMHAWFSPEGKRLGYAQKLSELAPGAALTKKEAQALVEKHIALWCPNFTRYKLIEHDSEKMDSGRVDHNFTYERFDVAIGKGFYRFSAVVRGDMVTTMEPSVKIPDNFLRRYKQMRSANNLLQSVGSFFFRSLYILFFGLLGLIFFYRRSYLLVRASCFISALVAGGMLLRGLNDYPLWWSSYNTIQTSSTFVMMKLFEQIVSFLFLFPIIFLSLVVAEAAGRFVYKNHIQLFQICTWTAAGSREVMHQVMYGYLMVPFMFLYALSFAYITSTYFGWWYPAGSLSDPNVVATCFPWLGAITISLYAGFFEEVVCRALPFAMTAVLTRDSKYKKFWFIAIFMLQAFIFGAAHANYPNQPCYARLVELIVDSFGFALLYLQFGLLPGIITHFTFDAIWFAMPIFTSNLIGSQIMVMFLIGLPLWIVCAVYLYNKQWHTLPANLLNQAYQEKPSPQTPIQPRRIGDAIPMHNRMILLALGICGLFAWVSTYRFCSDTKQLLVSKSAAIEIARQSIHDKFGKDLDATWTPVTIVQDDCSSTASRFMWQVYGKDVYDLAQSSYLCGSNWLVRFVQFTGNVEDRGEEYGVVVSSCHLDRHAVRQPIGMHAGHVMKAYHVLPEHFAGAEISQEQAQDIVNHFIEKEYLLRPQDTKFISVNGDKFDNRRDWTIVMQDTQVFDFSDGGQARILVKVSGDVVTEYTRYIFVPEDWTRQDQAHMMSLNLIKSGLWFLLFLLMACGCMFGIPRLLASRLGLKMMRHKAIFIASVSLLYSINSLYVFIGSFNTAEPFYDQVTRVSLGMVTQTSYQILFGAIFLAVGAVGFIRGKDTNFMHALILSIASAFVIVGTSSLLHWFEPLQQPIAGNYAPIGHWMPTMAFCGGYLKIFYLILSLMIAMFVVLKTLRHAWPQHIWMQLMCAILFCLSMEAVQASTSIPWMLLHGVVIGCMVYGIYYLVLRFDMTLLPLTFAAFIICMIIPELLCPPYVGASWDATMAIVSVITAALFFYERALQE